MTINELIEELEKIEPMYRDNIIRVWIEELPAGKRIREIETIDDDEGEFLLVTS